MIRLKSCPGNLLASQLQLFVHGVIFYKGSDIRIELVLKSYPSDLKRVFRYEVLQQTPSEFSQLHIQSLLDIPAWI